MMNKIDTGVEGPYSDPNWRRAHLVLLWLSGVAVGLLIGLLSTGN